MHIAASELLSKTFHNRMSVLSVGNLSCHIQVCREADGFQRSLVSPEFGLRRLVHDSVATVLDPVDLTVRRVHQVLLDASR